MEHYRLSTQLYRKLYLLWCHNCIGLRQRTDTMPNSIGRLKMVECYETCVGLMLHMYVKDESASFCASADTCIVTIAYVPFYIYVDLDTKIQTCLGDQFTWIWRRRRVQYFTRCAFVNLHIIGFSSYIEFNFFHSMCVVSVPQPAALSHYIISSGVTHKHATISTAAGSANRISVIQRTPSKGLVNIHIWTVEIESIRSVRQTFSFYVGYLVFTFAPGFIKETQHIDWYLIRSFFALVARRFLGVSVRARVKIMKNVISVRFLRIIELVWMCVTSLATISYSFCQFLKFRTKKRFLLFLHSAGTGKDTSM